MKGRIPLAQSRTAILGYLAARTAGLSGDKAAIAAWLNEKGMAVGLRGLRDALATRAGSSADPQETGWIREALDFNAMKLDLDLAIVVFRSPRHPANLLRDLRSLGRVIRVYRSYEGALVVLLAYAGARERGRIQIYLEEREPSLQWLVVREVDESMAAGSWLSLALRAAQTEGLLVGETTVD